MSLLNILSLIKDTDSLTALLLVAVLFMALWQGWITISGINLKKKSKNQAIHCLRGRGGSCELVRLQMEKAEQIITDVRTEAIAHYMRMRKEELGSKEGLANDREVHHYRGTLCQIESEIKDRIRYFFRENHLAEMDDSQFNIHITKRAEEIINIMVHQMDLLYYPGSNPDRIKLYDYNMTHLVPKIKEGIYEAFREGRVLAIQFSSGKLDQHFEIKGTT